MWEGGNAKKAGTIMIKKGDVEKEVRQGPISQVFE